ncbi:hypothetical protein [Microseira wollei]|uniref:hypothetical protein n=1 Tax=Microseira wollei TaxID=467598 RepID=UPI001CFF20AA|nr:hypothetical protein [Microseira wollei]
MRYTFVCQARCHFCCALDKQSLKAVPHSLAIRCNGNLRAIAVGYRSLQRAISLASGEDEDAIAKYLFCFPFVFGNICKIL